MGVGRKHACCRSRIPWRGGARGGPAPPDGPPEHGSAGRLRSGRVASDGRPQTAAPGLTTCAGPAPHGSEAALTAPHSSAMPAGHKGHPLSGIFQRVRSDTHSARRWREYPKPAHRQASFPCRCIQFRCESTGALADLEHWQRSQPPVARRPPNSRRRRNAVHAGAGCDDVLFLPASSIRRTCFPRLASKGAPPVTCSGLSRAVSPNSARALPADAAVDHRPASTARAEATGIVSNSRDARRPSS